MRALRWLWRSRGRHYRLLHEEELSPRYQSESSALAKFIMSYSRANTKDTDVLFDLIRVFLQPLSSVDLSFIKEFLSDAASVHCAEQNAKIIARFATLLSSDGSEETKLLSAQMLVPPILKNSSVEIFKEESVLRLIEAILNVEQARCGPKLTCEVLKIVDMLIERIPDDIGNHKKDFLKFIWDALKSNDLATKHQAFKAVSRFIYAFDTPAKVTLQVYRSLLRDTSDETTNVGASLKILGRVLNKRLNGKDFEAALTYTVKVISDAASVTQTAHIWESIIASPQVYVSHKSSIMPLMVQALPTLGLQRNAPPEIRELAVSMARVVFDWSEDQVGDSPDGGLDGDFINIVLITLVNIAVLNANYKPQQLQQQELQNKIMLLLKHIICSRPNSKLDSSHLQVLFNGAAGAEARSDHGSGSSKTARKESIDSKSAESGGSMENLLLRAELTLLLLRHDPQNDFIEMSTCQLLDKFISEAYLLESGNQLEQILGDMLVQILSGGHESKKMVAYIMALLEKALRRGSANHQGAYFVLTLIEKVWGTNQAFVEPLVSSLADFAGEKANDHVRESATDESSDLSPAQLTENGYEYELSATPTLGIYETACGLGFKPPAQGSTNGAFKNQIVMANLTPNMAVKSLILSMRLLGLSDSLFVFSNARETFMRTVRTLLESSNSLPVLMQCKYTV